MFKDLEEAKNEIKKLRELASSALNDNTRPKTDEKGKCFYNSPTTFRIKYF